MVGNALLIIVNSFRPGHFTFLGQEDDGSEFVDNTREIKTSTDNWKRNARERLKSLISCSISSSKPVYVSGTLFGGPSLVLTEPHQESPQRTLSFLDDAGLITKYRFGRESDIYEYTNYTISPLQKISHWLSVNIWPHPLFL